MNRHHSEVDTPPIAAVMLTLNGRVQGIGLRPAIAAWAERLRLEGHVSNTSRGVELFVQGPPEQVSQFENELDQHLPAGARVDARLREPQEARELEGFTIGESLHGQQLATEVPPDIAVCGDCLSEIQSTADRRFHYPFTSCTNCGPRYSIIRAMPYDRARTSMDAFPQCPRCCAEYASARDRRFHAQTNACPECGPQLWATDTKGHRISSERNALDVAAAALSRGEIVALRGLGGYQLLADATSESAVSLLRQRKRRRGKPLAVMVDSLRTAETLAIMDHTDRQTLASAAAPIVLLAARNDSGLATGIHPGLNTVGLMLPTTPLHALLLGRCPFPLVVTSANREGKPMAYQSENLDAETRSLAEVWLEHDRVIERPVDDSVVRWIAGRSVTIRLGRGMTPLPLKISSEASLVALGAHQKIALALSNGEQSLLGPHIGDLESVPTCSRFEDQVQTLMDLYGVSQPRFVVDRHPEYFTTTWAERQSNGSPGVERIQHHHAHIVAGMLEHDWLDRRVLGVAFDGTGWGDDDTIWGGEFLVMTATGYERIAHVRPFRLPGGERAVREPWRVAVSLVSQATELDVTASLGMAPTRIAPIRAILNSRQLAPRTTSAGRLFDGVAALILRIEDADFEGQPAMMLEAICDPPEGGAYEMTVQPGSPMQLDWRPLIRQILNDRHRGVSPGVMAMRFHRGLARTVSQVCRQFSSLPVVFGGGVFQNRCLGNLLQEELDARGQPCGFPGIIPPNDGGLAAGQLAIAAARAKAKGLSRCV